MAREFISHSLRSGKETWFWLDNWSGKGRLIEILGERGTRILGITRSTSVADVVVEGNWSLKACRDPQVNALTQFIKTISPPDPNAGSDLVLWRHGESDHRSVYSSKKTWMQICPPGPTAPWWRQIWFTPSIPRHAFITWLTIKDKLTTGDRSIRWGQIIACSLCGDPRESRDHLFFGCPFSFTVWRAIAAVTRQRTNPAWIWTLHSLICSKQNRIDATLTKLGFQATIYHLWRERNARGHGRRPQTTGKIVENIKCEISMCLQGSRGNNFTRALNERWNALV